MSPLKKAAKKLQESTRHLEERLLARVTRRLSPSIPKKSVTEVPVRVPVDPRELLGIKYLFMATGDSPGFEAVMSRVTGIPKPDPRFPPPTWCWFGDDARTVMFFLLHEGLAQRQDLKRILESQ